MMTRKNVVFSVLIAFCLLSPILMAIPTWSATKPYDPLVDYNEDGTINMRDINYLIQMFNTLGTPLNRTALLNQQSQIDNLTSRINNIETLLYSMNNTLVLVWDSEWCATAKPDTAIYFGKTLNITDALVYMIGKQTLTGTPHQIDYGGFPWNGAYWWNLTPTSITVRRHTDDVNWVYVRITIWQKVALS